ncbi:hypothetical protein OWV82_021594 [Melia azedarach]|uniref:Uncharacterized protein n=1 Tax=Melia azedarach TaxID=155640 RepID=A0ACC1X1G5_MELAZ|nr:hypothetical protein OWV82_021594 [Melia azedarach]
MSWLIQSMKATEEFYFLMLLLHTCFVSLKDWVVSHGDNHFPSTNLHNCINLADAVEVIIVIDNVVVVALSSGV